MGTFFSTSKAFPKELRSMGHYRGFGQNMNTESAVADIFRSLTTGAVDFFGGSSSAAKQAAAEAAAAQAQAGMMNAQIYGQQQLEGERTKRTLIWVGAGLASVFLVVTLLKPTSNVRMGRHRKKRRR